MKDFGSKTLQIAYKWEILAPKMQQMIYVGFKTQQIASKSAPDWTIQRKSAPIRGLGMSWNVLDFRSGDHGRRTALCLWLFSLPQGAEESHVDNVDIDWSWSWTLRTYARHILVQAIGWCVPERTAKLGTCWNMLELWRNGESLVSACAGWMIWISLNVD